MARQEIILGTPPTGLGGDPPRVASIKINDMTQELYDNATSLGETVKDFDEVISALDEKLKTLGSVSSENVVPIEKGGTGGTTQALARSGLGLGSAAVADLVGTMANGAILEQGTNANGSFIKFADGTLKTWGVRIISYGVGEELPAGRGQAWDGALQPATFVGQPSHSVTLSFMTGQDGTGNALYTLMQTYWMSSRVMYVGVNTGHAPAFVHPPMEYGTLAAGSFVASFQSSGRWK